MKSWRRTKAIAVKEVRQLSRDRLTFGMIIGIPVVQLLLFGFAINNDVRHIAAGVADLAGTSASRQVISSLEATQVLDIKTRVRTAEDLEDLLRVGRISVGVYIPPDFERRIARGDKTPVSLLVDASDPVILGQVQALRLMPLELRKIPGSRLQRTPGLIEIRAFYNPERRTEVQIVPGLIGVILTLTMVLFTSIAIVRERELGNMEMLITTPVKSGELMIGKILPYIVIGVIQIALILGLGYWVFRVPINGTLIDVFLGSMLFVCASLTLGLLISSFAKSQFQAFQLTLFVFLPSLLLSGFMFPFDGMPRWAQVMAEAVPLTHFLRIIRGVVLRGATLLEMWPEVLALTGLFLAALLVAILRFNKRLD
jgi:ABC-2 type transport system permease protein